MPLPFRHQNRAYARSRGYFWLPCDQCGQCFGGHEPWASTDFVPSGGGLQSTRALCAECACRRVTNEEIDATYGEVA